MSLNFSPSLSKGASIKRLLAQVSPLLESIMLIKYSLIYAREQDIHVILLTFKINKQNSFSW